MRLTNGREYTIIDVRQGGPGNTWKVLDVDAEMNGPSGGEAGVESIWGTSEDGGAEYLGTRRSGNAERLTGQVMIPMTAEKFLENLQKMKCEYDLRWRYKCDDPRILTNFKMAISYFDGRTTSRSYGNNLRDATEGINEDIKEQYDFSAGIDEREIQVVHLDITKQHSDAPINKIRRLYGARCAGICGDSLTGEEWYGAVTDRDSTSGYAGNPAAKFIWTSDNGNTWTESYINVFTAADATDFLFIGGKIIVASPQKGVAYASFEDIQNGVAAPWVLATGVSAANALAVTPNGTVWTAANSGVISKSGDGGYTFSTFDNGLTSAQNLNSVAFGSDDLGWFGGNNGVLIKYASGALSLVTVKTAISGGSTLAGNINVVQVPPKRSNHLYIGAADGKVWRTHNSTAQIPLFNNPAFNKSGEGAIDDIQFVGFKGTTMYVIQSNGSGYSRVLLDDSGGAMADNTRILGDFTNPGNFNMNSIAPANLNSALVGGEIHESYAFIGKVTKASA